MTPSSPRGHPDAVCRARYLFLARECRRQGLDPSEVERSARELSYAIDMMYYLKSAAYKPTGVALGCPLPDKRVAKRLWRLSRLADKCLTALCRGRRKRFAFVPPDWYHVTLVNRSHFEFTEIISMTEDEREDARKVIAQISGGLIVLHLNGLVLTAGGRLIVPGFPSDDRVYELRSRLVEAMPQLRINVPITAHIKLGHVLAPLNADELKILLSWVALCGEHVSARLIFYDVYTPAGRIAL